MKKLKEIYLPDNLTQLPPQIGKLINLTDLDLGRSKITNLPSEIGGLSNLESFNIEECNIVELPSEFCQLNNLTSLKLSKSNLKTLPSEIGLLSSLTYLDVSETKIDELPNSIGQLGNLKHLNLSKTTIEVLPNTIGQLRNLTYLDLSQTKIRELPLNFSSLKALESLYLSDCMLLQLPNNFSKLNSLNHISLSKDLFSSCVPTLLDLKKLQSLTINEIKRIDDDIVEIHKHPKLERINFNDSIQRRIIPFLTKVKIQNKKLRRFYAEKANRCGILLSNEQKKDSAHLFFQHVVKIDSSYFYGWHNLGFSYFEIKKYNEALQSYENAIKVGGSDVHLSWMRKGYVHERLGQKKIAIESYTNAIETCPYNKENLFRIATLHRKIGKFKKALTYYQAAFENGNTRFYSRAYTYLKIGNFTKAKIDLNTSDKLNKNDKWLYFGWACYYAQTGDKMKAIDYLQKSINKGLNDRYRIESEELLKPINNDETYLSLIKKL